MSSSLIDEKPLIAIYGLGYVGLPLALAFGEHFQVLAYDQNPKRIEELRCGKDHTRECTAKQIAEAQITFTADPEETRKAKIYIVTVPTPIDQFKALDLSHIRRATQTVAGLLNKGDYVIYESTVYPGCTEEVCIPLLEESGLKLNRDFFVGYSPERIVPGEKKRTLDQIVKVTSASCEEAAEVVDKLYQKILKMGTHRASSIQVAEASKAIENAQRDVNISFVNELALLFDRLAIDTTEVLEAAGTKWNFLPFRPGLVGGHCIGVDPYYLAHKAESVGFHPQVILSGRRINDNMGRFVASKVVKLMIGKGIQVKGARVLLMGITFKENCTDTRNSRVVDIYHELREFGAEVDVYDPWVSDKSHMLSVFGVDSMVDTPQPTYEALILAVAHQEFLEMDIESLVKDKNQRVIYDIKAVLPKNRVDGRL